MPCIQIGSRVYEEDYNIVRGDMLASKHALYKIPRGSLGLELRLSTIHSTLSLGLVCYQSCFP